MIPEARKPDELANATAAIEKAFNALRDEYNHGVWQCDLSAVSAVSEQHLKSPSEIAASTMRKMQLLWRIGQHGVSTTNDIVIGLCAEMLRALHQLSRVDVFEENTYIKLDVLAQRLQEIVIAVDISAPITKAAGIVLS